MNKQEMAQVMAILKAAYPAYYAKISKEDAIVAVNLWTDMFSEEDAAVVVAAVKALIATKTDSFPPGIGAVKERIARLTRPMEMTEIEAWALVAEAVRKTDWNHPEKQFKNLPGDVQAVLGSPHTLCEYGMVSEEQFNTVVASNFQRSFRAKRQHIRDYEMLPLNIKNLISQITGETKKCPPVPITARNTKAL